MKKLLELKALDTEVRDLLRTVTLPIGVNICHHLHYAKPFISIYYTNHLDVSDAIDLEHNGIVYSIDKAIDEQQVDEILEQIEKVLQ